VNFLPPDHLAAASVRDISLRMISVNHGTAVRDGVTIA
jgi:hypothetical protein